MAFDHKAQDWQAPVQHGLEDLVFGSDRQPLGYPKSGPRVHGPGRPQVRRESTAEDVPGGQRVHQDPQPGHDAIRGHVIRGSA